jgi:hypothetical protein
MTQEFAVNSARPLYQLSDEVHSIFMRHDTMSRAMLGGDWYSIQDDHQAQHKFLAVQLGSKNRLKITYHPLHALYYMQFQSRSSDKGWTDKSKEQVAPRDVVSYLDRVISNALSQNKNRNKLRLGLAAAGITAATLFACGESKAEEAPGVPDQDHPVAMQQHLEP